MAYLFPTEPLISGETLSADYPAAQNAIVAVSRVYASGGGSAQEFPLSRTSDCVHWRLRADTTNWATGAYTVEVWEECTDSRRVISRLPLQIVASGVVVESSAAKAIEHLEKYLSGDLSVAEYQIAGAQGGSRALKYFKPAELLELLRYWRSRLASEQRRARGQTLIQHIHHTC